MGDLNNVLLEKLNDGKNLVISKENDQYVGFICSSFDNQCNIQEEYNLNSWKLLLNLESILLALDYNYKVMVTTLEIPDNQSFYFYSTFLINAKISNNKIINIKRCSSVSRTSLADSLMKTDQIIQEHFQIKKDKLIR